MQIFASVKGRYIEPATPGVTVQDIVSHLQMEAQSVEETQVMRDIYQILLRGGTISVTHTSEGLKVDTQSIGPGKPRIGDSTSEGSSLPLAIPAPESAPVTETVAAEPPLPHEHFYEAKLGVVEDGDASWLKCACGEWSYFDSRVPQVGPRKTSRTVSKPN